MGSRTCADRRGWGSALVKGSGPVVVGMLASAAWGCGLASMPFPSPAREDALLAAWRSGPVFMLTPAPYVEAAAIANERSAPAEPAMPEPDAVVEAATSSGTENRVRLMGNARFPGGDATALMNVREGKVTGTPVAIIDARTGRRLANAVTYYDGSFGADIAFKSSRVPLLITLDLVDAKDQQAKTTLTATAVLKAGEAERKVLVSPGSTALTVYLRAAASLEADALPTAGKLTEPPADDAGIANGKLAALITKLDDTSRQTFTALAEKSPELKQADTVAAFKEGIRRFVGRIGVSKSAS